MYSTLGIGDWFPDRLLVESSSTGAFLLALQGNRSIFMAIVVNNEGASLLGQLRHDFGLIGT